METGAGDSNVSNVNIQHFDSTGLSDMNSGSDINPVVPHIALGELPHVETIVPPDVLFDGNDAETETMATDHVQQTNLVISSDNVVFTEAGESSLILPETRDFSVDTGLVSQEADNTGGNSVEPVLEKNFSNDGDHLKSGKDNSAIQTEDFSPPEHIESVPDIISDESTNTSNSHTASTSVNSMDCQPAIEGTTSNKKDPVTSDWSKEITALCKKMQASGDECTILYLNKGVNQKSYLHGLGTQKGIDFLNQHTDLAKMFISFCYNSPVRNLHKQVYKPDPVTGEKRKIPDEALGENKKRKQDDGDDNDEDNDDDFGDDSTTDFMNESKESVGDEEESPKRPQRIKKEPLPEKRNSRVRGFKCSECDFVASHPLKLKEHKTEVHTENKVKVKVEKVESNTLGQVGIHKKTGKKEYACRDCNFVTEHPMTLRKHVRENHSETWEKWVGVSSDSPVSEVETGHTPKLDDSVRGKRKSAILFKKRMSEIREMEENKKKFSCKVCNHMFVQRNSAEKHLRRFHRGKNLKDNIIFHQDTKEKSKDSESEESKKKKSGNIEQTKSTPSKVRKKDDSKTTESEEVMKMEDKKSSKISDRGKKAEKKDVVVKEEPEPEDSSNEDSDIEEEGQEDSDYVEESEGEDSEGEKRQKYTCAQCPSSFISQVKLNNHLRVVHQQTHFSKRITGKYLKLKNLRKAGLGKNSNGGFVRESNRLQNLKEMTRMMDEDLEESVQEKKCLECNTDFKTFKEWLSHIGTEDHDDITTEETNFYCFTCCKFFTCVSGLQNHMRITKHTGNSMKRERKCMKIKSTEPVRKRPLNRKKTQYRCTHCRNEFIKQENCEEHVKAGTCMSKFIRKCLVCKCTFFTRNLYAAHPCMKDKPWQEKGLENIPKGWKGAEEETDDFVLEEEGEMVSDSLQEKKCIICFKEFPSLELYRSHLMMSGHEQISEKETIFVCYTCKNFYTSEDSLRAHMMHSKHTGNEEKKKERLYVPVKCTKSDSKRNMWYRCTCCCAEFKILDNVKNHVEKATCIPKFKRRCKVCMVHFTSNNLYQLHMKRGRHFRRDPKMQAKGRREDIEPSVEEETIYKCYTCDKFYASKESLRRHMDATKHSGDPKRDNQREVVTFRCHTGKTLYRCSLCKIEFTLEKNCLEHIAREQCNVKYKRKCPLCNVQVYSGINLYYVHMLEKHPDEYPFRCEDCPLTFYHLAAYNCHRVSHNRKAYTPRHIKPEETEIYYCDICNKGYNDKGNMLRHKKSHTATRDFVCELCGKSYKRNDFLKFHLKYSHKDAAEKTTPDPDCTCDICGKELANPKGKYAHMKQAHNDEKPFCCEKCGYQAKQLGNLKFHYAMHHSDEVPYECDECGKKYKTKQMLKKHKGYHALQRGSVAEASKFCKTYTCADCGKSFIGKSNFESHCLGHTGGDMTCVLCDTKTKRRTSMRRHLKRCHGLNMREVDFMMKDMPQDRDLLKAAKNRDQNKLKQEPLEEVDDETAEEINRAVNSVKKQTSPKAVRKYTKKAQPQVSLLNNLPSSSNSLEFDPLHVVLEEVPQAEQIVELSATSQPSITTTTEQMEIDTEATQQIVLDGPLADLLSEKMVKAVVHPDGSISIHIQE